MNTDWIHQLWQSQPSRKRRIVLLVVATAIGFHFAALLWIQGMSIPAQAGNGPWAYDERYHGIDDFTDDESRKNEELARVFHTFVSTIDSMAAVPESIADLGGDFSPPDLELLELDWSETSSTEDASQVFAEIDWDDTQVVTDDSHDRFAMATFDVIVPSDTLLADQLSQATETALGVVEMHTADLLDGLLVGRDSLASVNGDTMDTQAGVLDDILETPLQVEQSLQRSLQQEGERFDKQLTNKSLGHNKQIEVQVTPPTAGNAANARIASSSDFIMQVNYAPHPSGNGYLFQLVLQPKPNVVFKTIAHNVFFLVDRSHSINEKRYQESKGAVLLAIQHLRPGDTFNILVFDDKVRALSSQNVPVNEQTMQQARRFLQQQPHGGIFASTDLYASLGNIVPEQVGEQELNTAILLSDGDTYLAKDKQRRNVADWTRRNAGKVSLFSLACGKGNNLAMLDLLSAFNKGRLAYARSFGELSGSLGQLLASIQNPVGKDLRASIIETKGKAEASLFTAGDRLPDLYRDTPYVLYGSCERLEDFYVFLQGRYYDRFLDIKQRVSFVQAQEVSTQQLTRPWVMQRAYELYGKYLSEGNHRYLTQVRQLLQPYGLPVAFE